MSTYTATAFNDTADNISGSGIGIANFNFRGIYDEGYPAFQDTYNWQNRVNTPTAFIAGQALDSIPEAEGRSVTIVSMMVDFDRCLSDVATIVRASVSPRADGILTWTVSRYNIGHGTPGWVLPDMAWLVTSNYESWEGAPINVQGAPTGDYIAKPGFLPVRGADFWSTATLVGTVPLVMPPDGFRNVSETYTCTVPKDVISGQRLFMFCDAGSAAGQWWLPNASVPGINDWGWVGIDPTIQIDFDVTVQSMPPPLHQAQRAGGMDSHACLAVQRSTRQASLLQAGKL